MATCLCKQPCERHAFPVIRDKAMALKLAQALEFRKNNPEALVLVDTLEGVKEFNEKWGYE